MENANRKLKVVNRHVELTEVGNKQVSTHGYRSDFVEDHLKWHLTQISAKWCSTDCMARTMYLRSTEANRAKVRRNMPRAFKHLLERGLFMVTDYDASPDGHGKIKAMKLFEATAGMETQVAQVQIDRMTRRCELTADMRAQAMRAIGLSDEEA